ncbi:MAG: threonine ammonia-lyase [Alphaproteobacteria bacterium]|nr:threonine ammonia-lyase [Alphaproteobacteria bacterium]
MSARPGTLPTYEDVIAARDRTAGRIMRPPLIRSEKLSQLTGADIWLKLENLHFTGAFKERGALNKLLTLTAAERSAGVVAASAGNHAQGLAHHASKLGVAATIVMPKTTPEVKVRATRDLGAKVELIGAVYDDAADAAAAICARTGATFVHPFDDAAVIAGQGVIGLEMLEDIAAAGGGLDAIIAPVGGGGLVSGIALAVRGASRETIEVIGVEASLFPSMANALDGGDRPVGGDTLAEGIAVRNVGELTAQIVRQHVDRLIQVDEPSLERSLSLLMNAQKVLVEGAGAAGLAAILSDREQFAGRSVGLVLCGGNIDQRLLSMILMRDLARSGRLARLRVELLDVPGQLVRVASIIAAADGNVIDVGHHRVYSDLPAKMTCMDVTIDTEGRDHLKRILTELEIAGYPVTIADY